MIVNYTDSSLTQMLLYGNTTLDISTYLLMLNPTRLVLFPFPDTLRLF